MADAHPAAPHHQTYDGFTLIELLVVITIIAVLAALLFPVFGKIRNRVFGVKSASNLRQLTLSAVAYAADHKGMLPWGTGGGQSWDTRLLPYGVPINLLAAPLHKYAGTPPRHYWVNANGTAGVMWIGGSANLMDLKNAANTIAFLELRDDPYPAYRKWRPGELVEGWGFLDISDRNLLVYYYNNRAPFSFCDGHVEMLNKAGVSAPAGSWLKLKRNQ